jgi:glutamate-ammonia-ligase adenylyltransferase
LEVAASAPDADQAFSYISRFITTVGNRPGYYRMLSDNPHATRLLAHVFGSSGYLANPLIQDPNVFERLLGVGTFAIMRSESDLRADLAMRCGRTDDPSHRLGIIRRFHQEETLRIGIHETGGAAKISQTTQQLSLVAETVIRAVLEQVYEPLRTRRRRPGSVLPVLADIPFAVVAMGKLGGQELGFGSDLDILFIYDEERQWRLEHTFFARLAQRLVRTLSSASVDGKMYEVDTRLRPSGNQGALVVSAEAFDVYHRDEAAMWERQALLRARPIAGPEKLLEHVSQIRWEHAVCPSGPETVRAEVSRMRDKLLENLTPSGADDVKFSPGGLVDIEFLVQATQLELPAAAGAVRPEGRSLDRSIHSQSTGVALAAMSHEPAIEFDARQLLADYEWLRRVEARLRMTDQRASSELPEDPAARAIFARRVGYQGEDVAKSFSSELSQVFDRVKAARDAYFRG